jgi:hypothetical protein
MPSITVKVTLKYGKEVRVFKERDTERLTESSADEVSTTFAEYYKTRSPKKYKQHIKTKCSKYYL